MTSALPAPDHSRRLTAAYELVARSGADVFVVTRPENVRYLTGFTGAGYVAVGHDSALVVTDARYAGQVDEEVDARVAQVSLDARRAENQAVQLLGGGGTVAFEADHVTVAQLGQWRAATPSVTWEPSERIVEDLRLTKDEAELARMRAAAAITSSVFDAAGDLLRPGMTEREAARVLVRAMEDAGSDGPAFDTMVLSGPNTGFAHWAAGSRSLATGEPIIVDMGATVDGYKSDMARVLCFGALPQAFRTVADVARAAKDAAEATIRAGVTYAAVDVAARAVIESAGYGEVIAHPTGHNVGLAIHERPFLSRDATGTIAAGCVVTVEPGVYLQRIHGCRFEDMVLVGDHGTERLTASAERDVLLL